MAGYIGSKASVTQVDGYNQAEADAEFVAKAGDTMTGGLNFGDNDKAIFGAGSDLQIYHDGGNSFISDTGAGNLILRGSSVVALQGANGENGVIVSENGAVDLRYDNSTKLDTTSTGIDVTGTVTATSFSGDGSALTGIDVGGGLGDGQTWQSVSRSQSVTYTNTTGKPIAMAVTYTATSLGQRCVFVVGGVSILPQNGQGSNSTYGGAMMIIPTGSSYYWYTAGGSASSITIRELR